MPLYMDINRGLDASVEDVQSAHLSDLDAQERFNFRSLKFWLNPGAGTDCAFPEV